MSEEKELRDFYGEFQKETGIIPNKSFDQLTDRQRQVLRESTAFARYRLWLATEAFKQAVMEKLAPLFEFILRPFVRK